MLPDSNSVTATRNNILLLNSPHLFAFLQVLKTQSKAAHWPRLGHRLTPYLVGGQQQSAITTIMLHNKPPKISRTASDLLHDSHPPCSRDCKAHVFLICNVISARAQAKTHDASWSLGLKVTGSHFHLHSISQSKPCGQSQHWQRIYSPYYKGGMTITWQRAWMYIILMREGVEYFKFTPMNGPKRRNVFAFPKR